MTGPSDLHVTYAEISTMLLESVDDRGSTNLSKSRDSDIDDIRRKLELN